MTAVWVVMTATLAPPPLPATHNTEYVLVEGGGEESMEKRYQEYYNLDMFCNKSASFFMASTMLCYKL